MRPGKPVARDWAIGGVLVALAALAPLVVGDFYLSRILTRALWLGIAAASLIFLAAYGGWVSLGQVGLYGLAGFTYGNLVAADGGVETAVSPWVAIVLAILITIVVGLLIGAISARSEGIYFLMITLAFGVIVQLFFEKATTLSGFGGINQITRPELLGNRSTDPERLFWIALAVSVAVYLLIRYVVRTPFGLSFQGVRDNPTRMRALGFNVAVHRTLAFGFGAFLAALAGILNVWWNGAISPGGVNVGATIDLLVIAVIGGLYRIEGAWLGAFVFAILDNWLRGVELVGARVATAIGIIFLAIILLSPGGLMGIYESVRSRARGKGPRDPAADEPATTIEAAPT